MRLYNIGQKLCKKDMFDQITELYRITSTKDKEFYKVVPVIGDKVLINKFTAEEEYEELEIHCRMYFEVCTLKNGEQDLFISIYNKFEGINYPYYASRLNYQESGSKKFGKFIVKEDYDNISQYKRDYDLLVHDIETKDYIYSIDLYLNDPVDSIIAYIKMDPKVRDVFINISNSKNLEYDNMDQCIKICLQNIQFMYWFHYNFRVVKVLFEIKDGAQLRPGDLFTLEAIIQERIVDYHILEYYHDIKLYKLRGNYFFIQDKNERTYLVRYVSMDDLPGLHVF